MLFTLGLSLTVGGWLFQLYKTMVKDDRTLSPAFLVIYALGVALLTLGNMQNKDASSAILNFMDLALAAAVLTAVLVSKPR